jgi:hypothetical protein
MPDAIAHKRLTIAQLDGLRRGERYAFPVEVEGRVVGVLLEVEGTDPVPAPRRRTCGYSMCGSPDCAHCFPDAVPGSVRYDDSAGEPKP